MKQLIEYLLEDGSTMIVEVDQPEPDGGLIEAARPDEVAGTAKDTLEKSIQKVRPAADAVLKEMRKLVDKPDEISVAFGIKLSAQVGAVLASTSVEANYTVTLKWKKL